MTLDEIVEGITSPSLEYHEKAVKRTGELATTWRALGQLNTISEQLCSIFETLTPKVDKRAVFVMAGDHGVAASGVSAFPQEVTMLMMKTMVEGRATINAFSRHANTKVFVTDVSTISDLNIAPKGGDVVFNNRKIRRGTADFTKTDSSTRLEAIQSILLGFEIASKAISDNGLNMIAAGEMGIGNTTPSAAIGCVYTELTPDAIVGRGSGVDDEGLNRKITAVKAGLTLHKPDKSDPVGVLSQVGGLEIGAICGVILAAAYHKIPFVLDGFIATAGALLADAIAPASRKYIIAGHVSEEVGHIEMLKYLDLEPILNLGMRLGEGTGAVCAMQMIEMAAATVQEIATLKEVGVQ